jgi:hypothetical protein
MVNNVSIAMSAVEMNDFLSESRIARIATVKPDNSPHVTPVWYLWENGQVLITVMKDSVKAKNIRQNNRVAVTIDNNVYPEKGVIIEGTAKIEDLNKAMERRICQRYISAKDLDKYLEHTPTNFPMFLVRIHPEKIFTWDYSKDPFLNSLSSKV